MPNDEIVNEVHAIYDDLKKSEAKHIAAGRSFVATPSLPPKPDSVLQKARFPQSKF